MSFVESLSFFKYIEGAALAGMNLVEMNLTDDSR